MSRNPFDTSQDLFRWRGSSQDDWRDEELRNNAERLARMREERGQVSRSGEPKFERGFMDRAFSVFNASQQFLFKLTQEVAEDGFQVSDVFRALSHGVDYYNPFSDAKAIDADEIRQIFMGPSADGVKRTFKEGATNLAISLFYDPTWLIPIAGPALKAAGMSAKSASILNRTLNPGILALDAAAAGARATGRAGDAILTSAVGAERSSEISNQIKRWVSDRHAGIDEGARELFAKMQYQISGHAREAGKFIREIHKVSPEGQALLARMVESNAVFNAKFISSATEAGGAVQVGGRVTTAKQATALNERQVKEIDSLLREADRLGIQKDFLWESYDKVQKVTMGLSEDLLRLGVISPEEFAEFSGVYLRRLYTAADNPRATLARIDEVVRRAEVGATPRDLEARRYLDDMQIFNPVEFRRQLPIAAARAEELGIKRLLVSSEDAAWLPEMPGFVSGPASSRDWFPFNPATGKRTLDTDLFIREMGEYTRENPLATLDDLLGHVQGTVFVGQRVPAALSELVANAVTDSMTRQMGIRSWQKEFAAWGTDSPGSFRQFGIQFNKIAEREVIPEFIRREILGEVESVIPRIAATAEVSGRQVEMARLFDQFSGVNRLSTDVVDGVRTASREGTPLPDQVRQQLTELYGADNVDDAIRGILRGDPDYSVGSAGLLTPGTRWASAEPTDIHKIAIKGEEFGSMDGKFVTPGLAAVLQNYQKLHQRALGETPESALTKLGDVTATFTNFFKFSKIIMDPGANLRDTVSSLLQIEITTGLPFRSQQFMKSLKASRDYLAGEDSFYHKTAGLVGYDLSGAGFFNSELQQMSRQLAGLPSRVRVGQGTWWDDAVDLMTPINNALKSLKDVASGQYQFRENLFRTYVFSSTYDDLAAAAVRAGTDVNSLEFMQRAARQAAAVTDRALFNYADVPLAVEFARKYGVAPFITFPFKAGPQLFHVMHEAPYRVLKYERGAAQWNSNWAGGSEALAAEIASLPDHKRDAMVVRLPFADKDSNPLYLDLSYFLPWYVINDLSKDVSAAVQSFQGVEGNLEDNRRRIAGDAGARGGIFTPIWAQLYEAFANNKDGLGRPIYKETATSEQKIFELGKYMYQFMAPPTFPGGSTADSVGKAFQAVAKTSPEPVDWMNTLGLGMRTMGFLQDPADAVNRYNERPISRALAGGGANIQALGNAVTLGLVPPPDAQSNDNPALQVLGGLASLFVNVTAADTQRQTRNELTQTRMSNTEIQRQIAVVRSNRNLSREDRRAEMQRLQDLVRENSLLARENILRMRPPR